MKANFISKEGNEVKLQMTFTAEEFENAVVDAYKKNKDRFTVDGFRKGKAPRKIIENHYGEGVFWNEALDALLNEHYPKAVSELDIEVIDSPRLQLEEIAKGSDVVVNATVEVFPEVEVKDYIGVETDGINYTVEDKDVEDELARVQKQQARMETVEDRPSAEGDTVIIDFTGSVDGVEFEGGKGENYDLKLGSNSFIPGFEDQLIGKNAGDDVDVVVTFPEDYHADNLAGKEAVFKCKVHEIKTEVLPEIDDDFAGDVSEFETLDEYKASIRERLQKDSDEQAANIIKNSLIAKVNEANDIKVPFAMIEDEADMMIRNMQQQLMYSGMTLESYLKYMGKTVDEFRETVMPDAEQSVKTRILLRGIARQENLEATEEEIEKELESFGEMYGQSAEDARTALGENIKYFVQDILVKKASDFIYDKAVITEPKEPEAVEETAEADAPAEEE